MKKSKKYQYIKYPTSSIKEALKFLSLDKLSSQISLNYAWVKFENEEWSFNNISEFYNFYGKSEAIDYSLIVSEGRNNIFSIGKVVQSVEVSVTNNDKEKIEEIFRLFDKNYSESKIPVHLRKKMKNKRVLFENIVLNWDVLYKLIDRFKKIVKAMKVTM